MNNPPDKRIAPPPDVLTLSNIYKSYKSGHSSKIDVLDGASLSLKAGEIVALVAPSGAGKSTLLHIAGLLDRPDDGLVVLGGKEMMPLSEAERTMARRTEIGFVYQFHHLLPEFSALENILIPQLANNQNKDKAVERASALLKDIGLEGRANHRPAALSGGEQQRVAFCRALANRPRILLADEPTGNLDIKTSDQVFETLISIARKTDLCALVATHNLDLAHRMDRIIKLDQGKIVSDF